MDILEKIVSYKKEQLKMEKSEVPFSKVKEEALKVRDAELNVQENDTTQKSNGGPKDFRFEYCLNKSDISFICEVKKASPSKGIISEDFPYLDIAKEYEAAGADCMSVLTEREFFKGSDEIFKEIRQEVNTPMIRKDFIIDEYQIYQAKLMGADAILLICAILDDEFLANALKLCDSLGMSALVETHDEEEIKRAIKLGARVIGVNNRNLKDFSVDIGNSRRLRNLAPKDVIFVAESGIKTRDDIAALEEAGVNAVLIGETLMRSDDKAAKMAELRGKN